ncbi:MAG TPA: LuxR C-terminal-related transcriptional regulator, partial [Polyangiaceae bacterium]|nr:LuxR C-terminal-related transcriptional regulator [Polyangiaceae bacterium]
EPSTIVRRALERLAVELAVAARLREHRRRAHAVRLSAAETRVVRLVLEGAPDKHIAAELGITQSTVSTFLRRVRGKLGCRPGEELLLLRAPAPSLERRLELFGSLTNGECDVASELLVGASYAEIAKRRGVSLQTVASQCAAVFRKCGVSGRRELAVALL